MPTPPDAPTSAPSAPEPSRRRRANRHLLVLTRNPSRWSALVPLVGILAGILEIVPNIGPVLAAIPAIILALFQGSMRFDLNYVWFAILVALTHFLIQQVENHYFVPRIIGGSVNLHPVVTIVGVLVGANLVGILGIFLAAPTIATIRVLARYVHNKVMDRDPFPDAPAPPVAAAEAQPRPAASRPASASRAAPPASDRAL